MSNILVLTSAYTGVVGASGICTRSIVDELKRRNHNVWVLGYDTGKQEENFYGIPVDGKKVNRSPIFTICRKLSSMIFPLVDKKVEKDFLYKSIEICKLYNIDVIVCIYFPLESISVLKQIKAAIPCITTIVYELDSVGDGIFASSKLNLFAKKNYEIWMNNNYNYADSVIIMNSHKKYWMNTWGKKHGKKLMIADIPMLSDKTSTTHLFQNDVPVMLYGGLLGKKYRSPNGLLQIVDELNKLTRFSLEFYSNGDCEDIISSYSKKTGCVLNHGYVEPDVLEEAIERANILISIGNRVSNSVPSKLISYFSYGKPVVHIASQNQDACEEYVNKYPLGLTLNENNPSQYNAEKLCAFLKRCSGMKVSYSDISNLLYMNTPIYSADLIEQSIKG